jgi:uncharacterized protein
MSTLSPVPTTRRRWVKRRWVALWSAAAIGLLFALGYFAVGAIAANMLTLPKRDFDAGKTPATLGMEYRDLQLSARGDGVQIAAWYIPPPAAASTAQISTTAVAPAKAIVMVHGRDASRTAAVAGHFLDLAAALNNAGYAIVMLDLRGHGQSADARFTFGLRERRDVLGAVDWLKTQGYTPEQVAILGLSLGAAAGIGAAVEEPEIGALVLDSAFADINPLIDAQWTNASGMPKPFLYATLFMARLLYGEDITQARPAAELARLGSMPVFLIHCQTDDYIPASNTEQLHAALQTAQVWIIPIPGCKHSEGFTVDEQTYISNVLQFLQGANLTP